MCLRTQINNADVIIINEICMEASGLKCSCTGYN